MGKNKNKKIRLNRRQLLVGTASLSAIALTSRISNSQETNPNNLPPNVPEWTSELGVGVDANPYGMPSEFENNVIRRNVEWLTASTESSVNFTPIQDLSLIHI